MVAVPPGLTTVYPNPAIPSHGDNAALLDWAIACKVNNRAYEKQTNKVRNLK